MNRIIHISAERNPRARPGLLKCAVVKRPNVAFKVNILLIFAAVSCGTLLVG